MIVTKIKPKKFTNNGRYLEMVPIIKNMTSLKMPDTRDFPICNREQQYWFEMSPGPFSRESLILMTSQFAIPAGEQYCFDI